MPNYEVVVTRSQQKTVRFLAADDHDARIIAETVANRCFREQTMDAPIVQNYTVNNLDTGKTVPDAKS